MKLNVTVITIAAMFAVAAASPMMETERLAEVPHSAYTDGKFAQGASGTAPPERLMASSGVGTAPSERYHVSDKLAQSTAAHRERFQDPSRLQDPSERAKVISNHLIYMFPPQGARPEYMHYNFLRQTAKLISEGNEQDSSAKALSEHLNLMATVIEQKGTLSQETRLGVQEAFKNYLKSHPTVKENYAGIYNNIVKNQAMWPQKVTHAVRNLASQNQVLSEQNQMLNNRLHKVEGLLDGVFSILSPKDREAVVNHARADQAHDREAFRLRQEAALRQANVNGAEKYHEGESHYATAPTHPINKQTSAEAEHIYGRERHAATKSAGVDAPHGAPVPTSESHTNAARVEPEQNGDEYAYEDWDDEDWDDEDLGDYEHEDDAEATHNTPEHQGKAEPSQVAGSTANIHPAPNHEKAAPASASSHQ